MTQSSKVQTGVVTSAAVDHVPPDPVVDFESFYRREYRAVLRAALYANATWEEAEDAVAAAMEEVLRRWGEIDNHLAYARRAVVSNLIKERQRGLGRTRRRQAECGQGVPPSAEDFGLTIWEDSQWVRQILNSLPAAQREVMALIVEGFTPSEVAVLLGKTGPAVRQNLHAARKRLAHVLTEQRESPKNLSHVPSSQSEDS